MREKSSPSSPLNLRASVISSSGYAFSAITSILDLHLRATDYNTMAEEEPVLPAGLPNLLPGFPADLPTIALPRISLDKLLNDDAEEAKRLVDICTRTGFFYLNLLDHPKGRELWKNACIAHDVGKNVMSTLSMKEKDTFLKRPEIGILDRG